VEVNGLQLLTTRAVHWGLRAPCPARPVGRLCGLHYRGTATVVFCG
jgi:hypothetical protein